ncbi:MAG: glycosyltransferase family 4 protein [Bacteroidetes bacterium]|nr:glycosyltransferase family 4 protein [Bacteroidota bacterium]
MRIALLTDGIFPYRIGGMQKHSYYLVKYFAKQGVHVDLYHLNNSEYDIDKMDFFTEEEKKNITSFVIPFPNKGRWPWHYLRESYIHSKMMYQVFEKQAPVDFIYSKGYTGWYFIKKKKQGAKMPPIGLRLHGYEIFQPSAKLINKYRKYMYLPLVRYLNNHADVVYSYGGGITDIIKKNLPKTANKIVEIPAAIEKEWIYEKNTSLHNPIRFAFLGRYDIRKGIQELDAALRAIILQYKIEFHFVGPVPKKFQIKSDKILYHGTIHDIEKIKHILQSTDVFVLPSHSEGMPNVILEAMASGCAILATRVGAVNNMVDEDNGWLIPPFSTSDIEQKINEILDKKIRIEQKKEKSVQKIKELFLWEKVIEKEIAIIKHKILE